VKEVFAASYCNNKFVLLLSNKLSFALGFACYAERSKIFRELVRALVVSRGVSIFYVELVVVGCVMESS